MIHQIIPTYLFILLIFSPVLVTVAMFYVSNLFFQHKWRAIHFAVQSSAIFYVLAVTLLLEQLLNLTVIGTILIILLLVLSFLLIIQWKKHTEVSLSHGLKLLSRISFLLFGLAYVLLLSYEIIHLILLKHLN